MIVDFDSADFIQGRPRMTRISLIEIEFEVYRHFTQLVGQRTTSD